MQLLTQLAWLALEVKDLDAARRFYDDSLSLSIRESRDREIVFEAGDSSLVVRRPTSFPRGGLHTHFAFSIPAAEYGTWWDRLESEHDLQETQFGSAKSLYLYDPDGNCVELGQSDVDGPGVDGIFEVVLEVESLERSESLYADLGFETIDRGEDRTRVRMDGPVALELWEPQLGIADARGGVHVDLGFETSDPGAAVDAIADRVEVVETEADDLLGDSTHDEYAEIRPDDRTRAIVRDPDGHFLSFVKGGEKRD